MVAPIQFSDDTPSNRAPTSTSEDELQRDVNEPETFTSADHSTEHAWRRRVLEHLADLGQNLRILLVRMQDHMERSDRRQLDAMLNTTRAPVDDGEASGNEDDAGEDRRPPSRRVSARPWEGQMTEDGRYQCPYCPSQLRTLGGARTHVLHCRREW